MVSGLSRGMQLEDDGEWWAPAIGKDKPMIRTIAVSVVACTVAACTPQYSEAQAGVKAILSDPESAQFTGLASGPDGNVCGLVNAKNRMGGYVGATPFAYQKNIRFTAIVASPDENDFRMLWLDLQAGGSRFEKSFKELSYRCHYIARWKDVCGTEYPMHRHRLCDAMAAYARQAKDSDLIQYATEIKVRAERRCGELLRVTEKNKGAAEPGTQRGTTPSNGTTASAPTLADMGLTRDESSRYQQLADMPDEHFETAVATAKATAGEVTTAFMLRAAKTRAKRRAVQGRASSSAANGYKLALCVF